MTKLNDADFINMLSSYDVICLQETFVGALPNINDISIIPNYKHFWSPALKLSSDKNYKGRLSGGVLVLVRNTLKDYFSLLKTDIENCVTINISKYIFGIDQDVILVNFYVPPYNSPFYKWCHCT